MPDISTIHFPCAFAPVYASLCLRSEENAGDTATSSQALGRLVEEFPGSHLTTRLLGYELLPVPEI